MGLDVTRRHKVAWAHTESVPARRTPPLHNILGRPHSGAGRSYARNVHGDDPATQFYLVAAQSRCVCLSQFSFVKRCQSVCALLCLCTCYFSLPVIMLGSGGSWIFVLEPHPPAHAWHRTHIPGKNGVYVDVGAYDPLEISNTGTDFCLCLSSASSTHLSVKLPAEAKQDKSMINLYF